MTEGTAQKHGYIWEVDDPEFVVINAAPNGDVPDYPIVMQRTEWRGEHRLDIRKYYWNQDRRRFCRTKKGVPVNHMHLTALAEGLMTLCPSTIEQLSISTVEVDNAKPTDEGSE